MNKHCAIGAAYGIALALCGIPYNTWQFWVLMPLAAAWATLMDQRVRLVRDGGE